MKMMEGGAIRDKGDVWVIKIGQLGAMIQTAFSQSLLK
jgi:hypothetical protein